MIHSICDLSVRSSAPDDTRVGGVQAASSRIALAWPRACMVTPCPATLPLGVEARVGCRWGGGVEGAVQGWPDGHTLGEVSRRWTSQLGGSRLLPAAGGGHCSGTPALLRPSRMVSSWFKFVG